MYERHRVDVRKELTDYHDRPLPDEVCTGRIDELRRIVERMGEINLMAIEEYEERSKRYEYLVAQKLDLETAERHVLQPEIVGKSGAERQLLAANKDVDFLLCPRSASRGPGRTS